MLLIFPCLHAEFLPAGAELPDRALFVDPGLDEEPRENAWRPPGLPMAPRRIRAVVREALGYGEQFKNPRDMAAYGLVEQARVGEESASAIEAELAGRLAGAGGEKAADEPLREQFLLALAWTLEENVLAAKGLERGMDGAWDRFRAGLGVDGEGEDEQARAISGALSNLSLAPGADEALPWRHILAALAPFLPEDAVLLTFEPDIAQAWREAGIEPTEDAAGLPQGAQAYRASVAALTLRSKAPEDGPLARTITAALLPTA